MVKRFCLVSFEKGKKQVYRERYVTIQDVGYDVWKSIGVNGETDKGTCYERDKD